MLKLKMMLVMDIAAGRRRLHIKAVCQSVREATTASGVDNAASTEPLNGIISPWKRLIFMQKQLGRNPEVLMSSTMRCLSMGSSSIIL